MSRLYLCGGDPSIYLFGRRITSFVVLSFGPKTDTLKCRTLKYHTTFQCSDASHVSNNAIMCLGRQRLSQCFGD